MSRCVYYVYSLRSVHLLFRYISSMSCRVRGCGLFRSPSGNVREWNVRVEISFPVPCNHLHFSPDRQSVGRSTPKTPPLRHRNDSKRFVIRVRTLWYPRILWQILTASLLCVGRLRRREKQQNGRRGESGFQQSFGCIKWKTVKLGYSVVEVWDSLSTVPGT